MVFYQDWKIHFKIILQAKKEKSKIGFYSSKEVFKLLLIQGYMLFAWISMFPFFQLLLDPSTKQL